MNTQEEDKNASLRIISGIFIMLFGILMILFSGEPMPEDPTILDPMIKSVLTGLLIVLIGALIFGIKRLKSLIKNDNKKE